MDGIKRAKNDNKINRLTYKENDILKNDMKSIDRAPSLSLILELENPWLTINFIKNKSMKTRE